MRTLIFLALLFSASAIASPLPEYPFVFVAGSASRSLPPDNASITFAIKAHAPLADQAYAKLSEVSGAVISFVEKSGVPTDDIVAQAIEKSVVRKTDDQGRELEIIGYDTVRGVKIEVKDLAKFPSVIEFLYRQENIERVSVSFGRSDAIQIQQNLTEEACNAAKVKAERLCSGFKQKLGSVRAISESGFSGLGSAFGFQGDQGYSYGAAARATTRDFRMIPATVSFYKTVHAIFSLE